MADSEDQNGGNASQAFLEHLDKSGFFRQIDDLGKNLATIAEDLKVLGDATVQRMKETENLVAHVFAIEAILSAILKTHPVPAEAIEEAIKEKTSGASGNGEGNPLVRAIAADIVPRGE